MQQRRDRFILSAAIFQHECGDAEEVRHVGNRGASSFLRGVQVMGENQGVLKPPGEPPLAGILDGHPIPPELCPSHRPLLRGSVTSLRSIENPSFRMQMKVVYALSRRQRVSVMFLYLGRFNFGFVIPQIIDDLGITRTRAGFVNACMFWGFGLGDLVHSRLSNRFSSRLWVALGGVLTAACNWFTSFGHSMVTLMVPRGINGFVNAMCYSPGIRLIAQWWLRRERGRALGTLGILIGFAMLMMWLVTGWVAGVFGWRAAFRYPVLWIGFMSLVFWLLVRDKPGDLGLPDYVEEDALSSAAETRSEERLHGLQPYFILFRNWRFLVACHVTGWGTLVRYGIVTWAPHYYKEVGGFDIRAMAAATVTFPIGMALGAPRRLDSCDASYRCHRI
jgi:sugar phosphate permease